MKTFRLRYVLAMFALCLSVTPPASAGKPTKTVRAAFDADPKWDSFRSRLLPEALPQVRQEFGYRTSQNAGGESAGEIGGTIQRSRRRASYAKVISPKTLDDALSASGKLSVTRAGGGSGVMFGWFNQNSRGWRTPNSLAFRLDGNGGKYWMFYEYGTKNWRTAGLGAFDGLRYQTTKTKPFAADGTVHDWSLKYDPEGNAGAGLVTFRVDRRTYELPLRPGHKQEGATFDRFGIWNVQVSGNSMDAYFDDLTINGEREDFGRDPAWRGEQNDALYEERVVRPYHDFGFSDTNHAGGKPGEIGGNIFRDERPAYYAANTGALSLETSLTASGRIAFRNAGSDSGIKIGWFDSQSKRTKNTPEHEQPEKNYLGVTIEGPSRVGHYFRASYGDSSGSGGAPTADPRTGAERPLIKPDGAIHRWKLEYSPQAADGNGRLSVTLDGKTHTLNLRPEDRARGASFDRFGLFNIQSGGHHVEVYLDDVSHTASAE